MDNLTLIGKCITCALQTLYMLVCTVLRITQLILLAYSLVIWVMLMLFEFIIWKKQSVMWSACDEVIDYILLRKINIACKEDCNVVTIIFGLITIAGMYVVQGCLT